MSKREDVARFRKSMHAAYVAQASSECEIEPFLVSRSKAFLIFNFANKTGGLEVAHIWGRHGKACDAFCAIIRLGHAAHSWGHVGTSDECRPALAVEACSLAAKFSRHQDHVAGLALRRSKRQQVECWYETAQPYAIPEPVHQWHWHVPSMDAARAACVGYNTLRSRVQYLDDQLRGTPFGDISAKLLDIVEKGGT